MVVVLRVGFGEQRELVVLALFGLKKSPNPRFMKKELAPSAHQKKFELAPFAPKRKSELAPLRDRKAKIARCGAPRKTSGAGLVALRPRGLGQILPRKALNPPEPACGAI